MPKSEWPDDEETQAYIESNWHADFGDRFQRLIFIGKPEILGDIHTELEKCLVTDEEVSMGKEHLKQLPDPFEDWHAYFQEPEDIQEA